MVMKTSDKAKMLNRMSNNLKKLASYEGNLPNTNDPMEKAAGELYLATEVKKGAQSLLKDAHQRAVALGVIIDKEDSTLEPQSDLQQFRGEHVLVTLNIREPVVSYRERELRSAMAAQGLAPKVISSILKRAETWSKPGHTFKTIILDDPNAKQELSSAK